MIVVIRNRVAELGVEVLLLPLMSPQLPLVLVAAHTVLARVWTLRGMLRHMVGDCCLTFEFSFAIVAIVHTTVCVELESVHSQ